MKTQLPGPWIFEENVSATMSRLAPNDRKIAEAYRRDGFVVLDAVDLCDGSDVDGIWPTLQERFRTDNRVQDAWSFVPAVREVAVHTEIIRILKMLYAREPIPFQTLNFLYGTEQATHSDTIHFSTLPHGFMCGVWVAMEDITVRQGPLHYYPGSHVLPAFTYADLKIPSVPPPYNWENPETRSSYSKYEQAISGIAAESGFPRIDFPIKKGTALIWSANLLHGGSPRTDHALTRKSQVTHYFFKGALPITPMFSRFSDQRYLVRDLIHIKDKSVLPAALARADILLLPADDGLHQTSDQPHRFVTTGKRVARKIRNIARRLKPI